MTPRHVLVVGADGLLGRRIVARLLRDGCAVTCAGRDPAALRRRFPHCVAVRAEPRTDDAAAWAWRLDGVDAVVDVAGLPCGAPGALALLDACAAFGVPRVVALAAEAPVRSEPDRG